MRRYFALVGAVVVSLLGCGGGDSVGNDAVCSDFRYQEDAQAALLSGARQLDRDRDGIACEDLPHRPIGGGGGTGAGGPGGTGGTGGTIPTPAPAYNLMSVLGETVSLVPAASSRYVMSVWGPFESVVDIGPLSGSTSGALTRIADSFITVSHGSKSGDLVPAWSSHGFPLQSGVGGIGFVPADLSVSNLSGTYRAIGQSCQQGRAPCTPVTGTLVVRDGILSVCSGQDAAVTTCMAAMTLPITHFTSDPQGVFVLGHVTARLLASASGSLAVSYQNAYESASSPNPTFARTTWFGVLQGRESSEPLGSTAFEGLTNAGALAYSPANSWALQESLPFAPLRRDAAGRLVLRGANGQLVTWSPEGGLQTFVQR